MSIAGIHGASGSEFLSPYSRRKNTSSASTARNKNTGPDTVSLSQEALELAQRQNKGSNAVQTDEPSLRQKLQPEGRPVAGKPLSGSSGSFQKSLFSMILESLFLGELAQSASSNDTGQGEGPQPPESTSLKDSENAAQIKTLLSDVVVGKADVSDTLTAMAATGSAGKMKRGVHNSSAENTEGNEKKVG